MEFYGDPLEKSIKSYGAKYERFRINAILRYTSLYIYISKTLFPIFLIEIDRSFPFFLSIISIHVDSIFIGRDATKLKFIITYSYTEFELENLVNFVSLVFIAKCGQAFRNRRKCGEKISEMEYRGNYLTSVSNVPPKY